MTLLLLLQLVVKSAAFSSGAAIPKANSCDGVDKSPAIQIDSEIPAGTQSLALIVDDPDAPNGRFVHWVLWNLSPRIRSIPEGIEREALKLPDGSMQGKNDFGNVGWNGPCPPPGKLHHYRFKVYALDGKLTLPARSSAGDVERAIKGHITAEGTLIGTFQH
jgi:Raf kinase inhibitor-like YbhB/YbcL family protein